MDETQRSLIIRKEKDTILHKKVYINAAKKTLLQRLISPSISI